MGEETQKPGRFLLGLTLKLHQSPPVKSSPSIFVFTFDAPLPIRVAMKIFEGFVERLSKEFIMGREPVSSVHYIRPGTCINRPLH